MIFGKSQEQLLEEKRAFKKKWFGKRKKVFAFLPVKLGYKHYAWLQYVWIDYNISKSKIEDDVYYSDFATYHLEDISR